MDADTQRKKLLNLNRLQTLLIIVGTGMGIVTGVTAWARGWLVLPDKVAHIESTQQTLTDLPGRVASIEQQQRLLWDKLNGDHDLLIRINQGVSDMKDQQQQLRQDIQDSKK
jgi:hypothetical protein